jgi:hypothetical protein
VAQWSKALHRPGSVAAGCDQEAHGAAHNWPSVVRVREGLAGRDILVSSCFGGRMDLYLRLFQVSTGVAAMRQDSSLPLYWGEKRGEKYKTKY